VRIFALLFSSVLAGAPSATTPVCLASVADPDPNVIQALGLSASSAFQALLASRDAAFGTSVTACTNDWLSLTNANAARPVVPDDIVAAVDAIRAGVLQLLQPASGVPVPTAIGGAWTSTASYATGALVEDTATGTVYESLQASQNKTPSTSSAYWLPLGWTSTMRFVMEQIGI
jgi:hypothetical protein